MSEQPANDALSATNNASQTDPDRLRAPWEGGAGRWRVAEKLPVDALDGVPDVSRLAVQLLHNRGVRVPEDAARFLATDWRVARVGLPNLERAVERMLRARDDDQAVVVWGDYDCDGMTSCALLVEALRRVGVRAEPYVALREDDGRGLNLEKLPELASSGTRLIVTTDCGTVNVEEVALAKTLEMDVIVTDHHPPHGPMAEAYALVNPHLAPDGAADVDAAGVSVAFRVAEALFAAAKLPDAGEALEALLDLVAIGTISDVVPLTPTNWALARAGLHRLNTTPRPGAQALLDLAGHAPGFLNSRDVSFSIAPRLNAAGRMGVPLLSVRLLLAEDGEMARRLADELEGLQQERQRLTEQVHTAARAAALATNGGASSPLIAVGDGWPLGILGLAASRLVDEFQRPAFVISRDVETGECRGSARALKGVNLGEALAEVAPLFRRFGGHAQAAGFTLAEADLPALLDHLRARQWTAGGADLIAQEATDVPESRETGDASAESVSVAGEIVIDCPLSLRRLVADIFEAVRSLEPYGPSFAEPIFISSPVRIVSCWRSGMGGRTLRMRLREGEAERVAFWPREGERYDELVSAMPSAPLISVVYSLAPTRDGRDYQPRILAIRAAE